MAELEENHERLKQAKAKILVMQSSKDRLNREQGIEQRKLDEAYEKLRTLGIENPEKLSPKELKSMAQTLKAELEEKLAALDAQIAQGEALLEQYQPSN